MRILFDTSSLNKLRTSGLFNLILLSPDISGKGAYFKRIESANPHMEKALNFIALAGKKLIFLEEEFYLFFSCFR